MKVIRHKLLQRLIVAAVFSACAAFAQSPSTMPVSSLVSHTEGLLTEGRYSESVPYLDEIITRLKAIGDDKTSGTLAFAMFRKGQALFLSERYSQAVVALTEYLTEFSKDGSRGLAALYLAEAAALQGKWPDVEKAARTAIAEPLKDEQPVFARQYLGEALARQEKWEQALEPLLFVSERAKDAKARISGAAMLVTALVRLERFDELLQYLPRVYATDAKYDIRLNIALFEGGSRSYEKENFLRALMFYRLVFFKADLIEHLTGEAARIAEELARPFNPATGTYERHLARQRELQREQEELALNLKDIEALPDYDVDVTLRIAQTYSRMNRHWESFLMFSDLYRRNRTTEYGDQGLFLAFSSLVRMNMFERALPLGMQYLDEYADGEFRGEVIIGMMRIFMQRGEFDQAVALASRSIGSRTEREQVAEILYLSGFCRFQTQEYEAAVRDFAAVAAHPGGKALAEPAEYWKCMGFLFQGRYWEGAELFEQFTKKYPMGEYADDAWYRWGICVYGAGDLEGAEKIFANFLEQFPLSALRSEGLSMQADIRASKGLLDEALADYREAMACAENISQYNYALFQTARVYELEARHDEIIALMKDYVAQWREESNFAEAAYWTGKAHKEEGRIDEALKGYLQAVTRFGNEPDRYGVDLIIDELLKESANLTREAEGQAVWDGFMKQINAALRAVERNPSRIALYLRLAVLMAVADPAQAEALDRRIMQESNIEKAGPITLAYMSRRAGEEKNFALTEKIYRWFVEQHEASDLIRDAQRAMTEVFMVREQYDEALELAQAALGRFGLAADLGWAQKRIADIYRVQGRLDEAIENYNMLFGVREWRGALTAEALYWIGRCYFEQADFEKAFAFFQRSYVLYEGYPEWAVKGYLGSAACLEKLGKTDQARATLREMLSREQYAGLVEYGLAQTELERLTQGGTAL